MDSARAKRMFAELHRQHVGGWVVTDYVAHGKSAIVLKAENGGEVGALKIFEPELVERFGKDIQAARVERELCLRGKVHPNLVRILDGGECRQHGVFYVVMEFLDCPSLAEVLADVPRDRVWLLISQVARAARFLEELGLAHRDIKPDNIAVSEDFRAAKLMDLGVLRPFGGSDLTDRDAQTFIGTLRYASPEFLLRQEEDTPDGWRAVTFYQLGGVLHDMIMRQRLFEDLGEPFALLVDAVRHKVPHVKADDVPHDLALLANNCLIKDPKLRLSLVNWDDFELREVGPPTAADAKDRIRRRLGHDREVELTRSSMEEERRKLAERKAVQSIHSSVESIIRAECIGGGLFPPLETSEWQGGLPNESHLLVCFRPSPDHLLRCHLSYWFSIRLLDANAPALELECLPFLSAAPLERAAVARAKPVRVFQGTFEEAVVARVVRDILYVALDNAQRAEEPTTSVGENWVQPMPMDFVRVLDRRSGNE